LNYAILHDLPFFQDEKIFQETKKRRLRFHHDVPARFGVIPRYGRSEDVRWFEAEPCYILHMVNCWEDGDWVVMDGCRQTDPSLYKRDPENGPLASMIAQRHRTHVLYRWRMNMKTGEVREHAIDDLNTEFPMVNPNYLGLKSRFSFNQYLPLVDHTPGSITGHCQTFDALVKYDTETGARQRWDYGAGCYGNETPFAPGGRWLPRHLRDRHRRLAERVPRIRRKRHRAGADCPDQDPAAHPHRLPLRLGEG
jgi:carotenoid cleavage dioxygenase-like enzyme